MYYRYFGSLTMGCYVFCLLICSFHGEKTDEEGVLEEAAVLGRLAHSSIVRLMTFESLPNCNYLVLEVSVWCNVKVYIHI